MTKEQVKNICKIVVKYDLCAFFSTDEFNNVSKKLDFRFKDSVVEQKGYIISSNQQIEFDLKRYENEILKVSIFEEDLKKMEIVREEISKESNLIAACSDSNYLDINIKNTNKGSAVKFLAEYLGIDLKEVIGIGDNENDLNMVKEAGLGVAMANSCKVVKENCDVITESNNDCGVAKIINQYIE